MHIIKDLHGVYTNQRLAREACYLLILAIIQQRRQRARREKRKHRSNFCKFFHENGVVYLCCGRHFAESEINFNCIMGYKALGCNAFWDILDRKDRNDRKVFGFYMIARVAQHFFLRSLRSLRLYGNQAEEYRRDY